MASTRGLLQTTLIYAVFYFLIWTMWPLVMWHLSRLVNKRDRFFRYLATYNWSMVIQAAIWLASSAIIPGFGLTGSAARITTVLTIYILCSITFIYYGKGSSSASGRQPPWPASNSSFTKFCWGPIKRRCCSRLLRSRLTYSQQRRDIGPPRALSALTRPGRRRPAPLPHPGVAICLRRRVSVCRRSCGPDGAGRTALRH